MHCSRTRGECSLQGLQERETVTGYRTRNNHRRLTEVPQRGSAEHLNACLQRSQSRKITGLVLTE